MKKSGSLSSESLQIVDASSCGTTGPVPVFNCIVILRRDDKGHLCARVANLSGIVVEGSVERDVLLAVARRFKSRVQECLSSNTPVPWVEPPEQAAAGEVERFIPVHL